MSLKENRKRDRDIEELIAAAKYIREFYNREELNLPMQKVWDAVHPFIKKTPRIGVVDPHLTTGYRAVELTPEVRERLSESASVDAGKIERRISGMRKRTNNNIGSQAIANEIMELIASGAVEINYD